MTKPGPSKKRKTVVVLSSDDEDSPSVSTGRPNLDRTKDTETTLRNASLSLHTRGTDSSLSKAPNGKSRGVVSSNSPKSTKPSPSKNQSKPVKAKPIYSFFNAATQKHQAQQGSTPEKPETSNGLAVDDDLIQDDDSQDEVSSAQMGSKFGDKYPMPTRQKRKLESTGEDGTRSSVAPRSSQLFRAAITSSPTI